MKIAYLDCISGVSGDMILGAFLDAGFKLSVLKENLSKLDLTGYKITSKKVKRHHISATKLDIGIEKKKSNHSQYGKLGMVFSLQMILLLTNGRVIRS